MQSDSVVSVDAMTVVHDKDCALNRPDALYAGRECDCSVIKAAQPQADPPLYTIRKDADGKVVVTTTAQPLPASSVASTDVEEMIGKLAGAAAHVSDPMYHNTIAGICEEAAAMLRSLSERLEKAERGLQSYRNESLNKGRL
jgi:hypothetical protein